MSLIVDRIIRSKRRTVALIVEYDGSVTVRAPMRLPERAIQEFAEKHLNWVAKKKAEMLAVVPDQSKQYIHGETFLFLGKEYALEVVPTQRQKLILDDRFQITESALENAELVFQK
jgi:predicted metal-dependent hydrolase